MTYKEVIMQLMLLGFTQDEVDDDKKWTNGSIKIELKENGELTLIQQVNGKSQISNYAEAERALNYLGIIL